MKIRFVIGIFALITLLVLFYLPLALADEGGIPLTPGVSVYEPGQKAIAAWNGQEEILIISTDVSASESTLVLRILPLPSNPKAVEKANFTSFTTLQSLLQRHAPTYVPQNALILTESTQDALATVVVTFHEKIGTHDITVVSANNASELTLWINNFLEENGVTEQISLQEFKTIIEDYMSRGFSFFVLDLIDVSSQQRSVEPILYWFETSFLYYPLRISSLFFGDTDIILFLLTKGKIGGFVYPIGIFQYDPNTNFGRTIQFNLTAEELGQVDPRIESLFDDAVTLTTLQFRGSLSLFAGDLIVEQGETLVSYPFMPSPSLALIPVVNLTTISELTMIPIDYHPPTIDLVKYSFTIDKTLESVTIRCNVEDVISGILTVTLFYQVAVGEWNSVEMKNINGNYTATIPLQTSQKVNFYIQAFDKAGNRAIEDNDKVNYLIDVEAYTRALIIQNLGIVLVCALMASAIALAARTYVKEEETT